MNKRNRPIGLTFAAFTTLLCLPAAAIGPLPSPILFDGDFEEVRPGTAPDCHLHANGFHYVIKAAGAWNFNMNTESSWELTSETWSVVDEAAGPPEGTGNSLRVSADGLATDTSLFILNAWRTKVQPEPGQIVRVSVDVFLPEAGKQGGSILVTGNQSKWGWSNTLDRAAQISFTSAGIIQARVGTGDLIDVMSGVPYAVWQSMRVDLDVAARSYDVYWAQRGEPMALLATDLPFRAADLEFLDHIGLAVWGSYGEDVASYWDNFRVEVVESND